MAAVKAEMDEIVGLERIKEYILSLEDNFKIQQMRKEAGFEVTDHIDVGFEGSDRIAGIFEKWGETIAHDVLAESISEGENGGYSKEWNINGEEVQLYVQRR